MRGEHGRELLIGTGQGGSDVGYAPCLWLFSRMPCSAVSLALPFIAFHENKLSFWLVGLAWLAVQCGKLGLAGTRSTCRGIAGGLLK